MFHWPRLSQPLSHFVSCLGLFPPRIPETVHADYVITSQLKIQWVIVKRLPLLSQVMFQCLLPRDQCVCLQDLRDIIHETLPLNVSLSEITSSISPERFCYPLHSSVHVVVHFSHVWLFATRWTVAHQAPLSMEFSRQEYWSGLPFPPPGHLPDPGTEPMSLMSLALASRSSLLVPPGKPNTDFCFTLTLPSLSDAYSNSSLVWIQNVCTLVLFASVTPLHMQLETELCVG